VAKDRSDLCADIERVQSREEARLLRIAHKSGFFKKAIKSEDIAKMFESYLTVFEGQRQSQLEDLKLKLSRLDRRRQTHKRREDALAKSLLGSFLMAQFAHKPSFLQFMRPLLRAFIDSAHTDKIQKRYTRLLETEMSCDLQDYTPPKTDAKSPTGRSDAAQRRIILGACYMQEFNNYPETLESMRAELATFLEINDSAATVARNKALLAEYLPKITAKDRKEEEGQDV
jgi:hypothetical protein